MLLITGSIFFMQELFILDNQAKDLCCHHLFLQFLADPPIALTFRPGAGKPSVVSPAPRTTINDRDPTKLKNAGFTSTCAGKLYVSTPKIC
jgi:hypothetical protein